MFLRLTCRGKNSFWNVRRFSSPAFNGWSKRIQDLENQYPGLFSPSFLDEQKELIANRDTSLSQVLSEYENARASVFEKSGEDVFMSLDENKVISLTPVPSRNVVQEKTVFEEKLKQGTEYVQNILKLQETPEESAIEKRNLKMIELGEWGDKLEQWKATLEDDSHRNNNLGLPISDTELDQWVAERYVKAPLFQRKSPEEKQWMEQLDEQLVEYLKSKDPNLDEEKWQSFNNTCNEVFHPHKINHYSLHDLSKSLFRAALWQSTERLAEVEKSAQRLLALYNDANDDDARIIRRMYEMYPDSHFPSLVALQLQITDPLFAARLVDEARTRLEQKLAQKAVKDVVRDFELPYLQEQRDLLQKQAQGGHESNPAILRQKLSGIEKEIASYDEKTPSLETVLDEILPEKLWSKETSEVKEAILKYAAGQSSLVEVGDAVKNTLKPSPADGALTNSDILQMSIRYHNAKQENFEFWNLGEFVSYIDQNVSSDNLLVLCRQMRRRLERYGIDPLLINLVNILIEDEKISEVDRVLGDFSQIMKIYRGEIEGAVTSAQELTEDQFQMIMETLTRANPGKKITMTRTVEPGLLAGFVVKAGVQKFDFSLLAHIEKSRQAMQV